MEEIKKAGQDGECILEYFATEMTRRGGRWMKHFVTTHNPIYEIIFYMCESEIIRRVLHWLNIDRDITNRRKVQEAIGDFFEFLGSYLIAQNRPDLFASLALNTVEVSQGYQRVEDALAWTHTTETLYMFTNYESGEVGGRIHDDYHDNGPLPLDICPVCCAEATVEDCSECGTCHQMVHVERCGPKFADDCQNCQAGRFYLYYPAGHSPAEIAGLQAAVTRNTANEAYPNAFRLPPGSNFATNNPAYVAATAVTAGHLQSGPGVHASANPGVRGEDLAACLAGPGSRAVTSGWVTEAVQAQESRQVQMQAYSGERRPPVFYNPSAAASNWTPSYSYTPVSSQITHAPPIFPHPDYAHDYQHVQNPMDPLFAQEAMSQQIGMLLLAQERLAQVPSRTSCSVFPYQSFNILLFDGQPGAGPVLCN